MGDIGLTLDPKEKGVVVVLGREERIPHVQDRVVTRIVFSQLLRGENDQVNVLLL